ncbi:hypothetical protein DFH06DRAFT_1433291 [Mycena polygramma]|nr:hypothetical protein DFH06DRAFT_1433291 [Mycena polygramma]
MHRCLYTDDIVRLVCGQLYADYDAQSLAALALTAQTIHPHALDFLWQVQTSIAPLLRCFPSDLWEYRSSDYIRQHESCCIRYPGYTIHLRRAIKPSDWDRVNLYSSRIRILTLGEVPEVDVDFLEALQGFAGANPLLPRLQCLSWKIVDEAIFPFIRIFLSPTITMFLFWPEESSPGLAELFHGLNTILPNLSDAMIFPPEFPVTDEPEMLASAAREAICRWNDLHTLLLPDLDQRSAAHLANMPYLKRLRLEDVRDDPSESSLYPFENIPSEGFPSLITLSMNSQGILLATTLLSAMSNSPLNRVIIWHTHTPAPDEWTQIYTALEDNRCRDSLKIVSISQECSRIPDAIFTESFPVESSNLRRLLSSPNITTLRLCNDGGFDIDGELLRLMAISWPHLQSFTLTTPNLVSSFPPRATLDSLARFVAHCPQISHLEYCIDARIAPRFTQKPKNRIWNDQIRILHLLDSPVANPERVATFLMDIFVNLEMICISSPWDDDEESTWSAWLRVYTSMGEFPSLFRTFNEHAKPPILFARDHILETFLRQSPGTALLLPGL